MNLLCEEKLTKSEKYNLICKLLFFSGSEWSFVEERNYLEAPSWEVKLQVNVILSGSGSKIQFNLSSWKVGVNER
jgi:hypothetical protein